MTPVPTDARPGRRSAAVVAAALVTATLLTGCGSRTGASPPPGSDDGRATRATRLLDRFAAARESSDSPALAVLPDDLERQDGDWEEAVGENNKLAWLSGHLVAAGALSASPGEGAIIDGSGTRMPTAVVSAQVALAVMADRRSDCDGCTDLQVTSAQLTTMEVRTSTGTATVPAWRFAINGTRVALLRVALPESALVPPPLPETGEPDPGDGLRADSFSVGPDTRTLRLHFTGSPDEPGPCGADYRAEEWSSSAAIVVTVLQLPRAAPAADVACNSMGYLRTVDVTLDTGLGTRAVLNLAGGTVVPRSTGQVLGIPVR